MSKISVNTLVLGSLPTNTYLVWNEESKECVIIDPSDGYNRIEAAIEWNGLKPCAIWLTHGHDDHFGSVDELKHKYGLLVYIMKDEEELVQSVLYNLSRDFGGGRVVEPDMFFIDGQKLNVMGTEVTVLHTPGHTPGGACYYFPAEGLLFTGDTLFRDSVGRSDFPGGDSAQLIRSIKEKLLTLPDETIVLPGHGPQSTIGYERQYNYFLQ